MSAERARGNVASWPSRRGGVRRSGTTDEDASSTATSRAGRLVGRVRHVLPYVGIVLGLTVLVRPVVVQWVEAWRASQGIDAVVATYDEMTDPACMVVRNEARAYNAALAGEGDMAQRLPYEQQLSWRGSEMIAYISIPKCAVRLPVYHGTEERVLMSGVGHLRGTSLPIGGTPSHCVLTAHTGMPSQRMFDDIHLLEPGDTFVIWALGEPIAYEVTGSEVVWPDDTSSLDIQPGKDLCTLVTCTPYGVNTHRLLVHAQRCPYREGDEEMPDAAVYVNNRTAPLMVASGAALLATGEYVRHRIRRRRTSDVQH